MLTFLKTKLETSFAAAVCGDEPDFQRDVQLQAVQLPEERER